MLFADANSGYNEAKYVICGVPFDGTSCIRKGSRLAPPEIRKASHYLETYSYLYEIDLKDVRIYDAGNLEVAERVDETIEVISGSAEKYISDGKIPIMLGGEHSLTLPFVKACKEKYSELGVVVLDAHLDLREEYEGERNSHACISKRIFEEVTQNYASVGIRSGAQEEYDYARQNKIKVFSAEDVFLHGVEKVVKEIREHIEGHIYLSIDMDAIDPAYAPAVGSPEPYGLTARHVRDIISCFAPYMVGFDLVEIAPAYDSGNTALLGAKLVRDLIAANAKASLYL